MNKEILINVKNLNKHYKIYNSKIDRLKEVLFKPKKMMYKNFKALENISFKVKRGDSIAIMGRNGSGKSTLLKIIAGVLTPTSGSVNVKGKITALLELGSGFNPELTGMENVILQLNINGEISNKIELDKKINQILEFADIGEFIYQPVKTYSSGMKARLAFSVSIHSDCDILIVDEALSVGDMYFKQKCIFKIKEMLKTGTTLFFVSHSLGDIKSFCNTAILLDKGKQISYGTVDEVCNIYQSNSIKKVKVENIKPSPKGKQQQIIKYESDFFYYDDSFSTRVTNRTGNGNIEFCALDLYDSNNKRLNFVESLQEINIRVCLIAHEEIDEDMKFGILIRDIHGKDVCSINFENYNYILPKIMKNEKIVLSIRIKLPLTPNKYSMSIGTKKNFDSTEYYDRCFNALVFEIIKRKDENKIAGTTYVFPNEIEYKTIKKSDI
jgi:teichoic acid transport system ATP-binding protein